MRNLIYIVSAVALLTVAVDAGTPEGIGLPIEFIESCKYYGVYAILINGAMHILQIYWDKITSIAMSIGKINTISLEVRTFMLIPMFLAVVGALLFDSGAALGGAEAQSTTTQEFLGILGITAALALGTFGVGLSPFVPKTEKLAIGVFIAGTIVIGLTSTFNSYYNRIAIDARTTLKNSKIEDVFEDLKGQSEDLKEVTDELAEKKRLTVGENNVLSTTQKRNETTGQMLAVIGMMKPDPKDIYGDANKTFKFMQSAATSFCPFIFSFLFAMMLKSVVRDRKIEAAKKEAKQSVEYHVPKVVEVPIPTFTDSLETALSTPVEKTVETLSDKGSASRDRNEPTGNRQRKVLPDTDTIIEAFDRFRKKNPKRRISKSFAKDAMKEELGYDLGSSEDQSDLRDLYVNHIGSNKVSNLFGRKGK